MAANITITISDEVAEWLRQKAAEESISVSEVIGRTLEDRMRHSDDYWRAYQRWKAIASVPGADATKRMSRDETHRRR